MSLELIMYVAVDFVLALWLMGVCWRRTFGEEIVCRSRCVTVCAHARAHD